MSNQPAFKPTAIDGVFELEPLIHGDSRGSFHEWYRMDTFAEATGFPFFPEQANMSVSAAGVVRGIHFADVTEAHPGQAKLVTCPHGSILDIVVDLRRGSETFSQFCVFELNDDTRRVLYLPSGIGHGFVSLQNDSILSYLTSTSYTPEAERAISIKDPEIGIDLGELLDRVEGSVEKPIFSDKDEAAPTIAELEQTGVALPSLHDCKALENAQRDEWVLANEAAGE